LGILSCCAGIKTQKAELNTKFLAYLLLDKSFMCAMQSLGAAENNQKKRPNRWLGVLAIWLGAVVLSGAQTNPVHIAVVSFSAPIGNQDLQVAATSFPDLLTTALSRDDRFRLVERQRIAAVWSEFHLTEAGLESATTVIKLGQTLSCDWLISGLFTQKGSNQQVWIKIIDTQSSVAS
jgi:TolB-like protein